MILFTDEINFAGDLLMKNDQRISGNFFSYSHQKNCAYANK